jgi:hypothetical protein
MLETIAWTVILMFLGAFVVIMIGIAIFFLSSTDE